MAMITHENAHFSGRSLHHITQDLQPIIKISYQRVNYTSNMKTPENLYPNREVRSTTNGEVKRFMKRSIFTTYKKKLQNAYEFYYNLFFPIQMIFN